MRFTGMRFDGISSAIFKLVDTQSFDPYVIKDVKGLGPPEINVSISTPLRSKAWHQNTFVNSRQIVVRIGLNPNYAIGKTVDALREELYWMIEGEGALGVMITVLNGDKDICNVLGFVSNFEPSIFSKTPELQITFDCLGGTLAAADEVELPFSNNTALITSLGTARAACSVELRFTNVVTSVQLSRRFNYAITPKETFALSGFTYLPGDILIIGSPNGDKTVTLIRYGGEFNQIAYLVPNSKWPNLDPRGVNILSALESELIEGNVAISKVVYTPQFWGV